MYEAVTVPPDGGLVRSWCGFEVNTASCAVVTPAMHGTVLAVGGVEDVIAAACGNEVLMSWLRKASESVARVGSVCTGAFLLGSAGIIGKKRVATHCMAVDVLADLYEDAEVDSGSIYVNDGNLWTSAGVTSGIDMALAMVEEDHGPDIKARVAKVLVVYAPRPGNQSQFSDVLSAQMVSARRFSDLVDWVLSNLNRQLRVEDLAIQAGMSERTFVRKFRARMAPPPDVVWLFRQPILAEWRDRGNVELNELIAHVVIHEFAHHFGWADEEIAAIDQWWV
ncbi:metallopeptidase family protein [Leisingera sp. M527]|uniref:metallopeptidase family protein n=1 Tax=Leisingera sp. M527 TaxID=2867014 RepID=UPI002202B91C|nr:metallopeptidase family protein [Leisingera sp. M527]UWQ33047.1 metallopeptidase family protein [Leisingera sp. M527]